MNVVLAVCDNGEELELRRRLPIWTLMEILIHRRSATCGSRCCTHVVRGGKSQDKPLVVYLSGCCSVQTLLAYLKLRFCPSRINLQQSYKLPGMRHCVTFRFEYGSDTQKLSP
eukprot:6457035-Amphidinium_carterae.1